MKRADLIDRYVVAAILLQIAGYAALSALFPHSDFTAVVEPLRRVPAILLVPIAILALPAVVIALALGMLVSVVGLRPTAVLVLVGIYLVSVASRWIYRSTKRARVSQIAR